MCFSDSPEGLFFPPLSKNQHKDPFESLIKYYKKLKENCHYPITHHYHAGDWFLANQFRNLYPGGEKGNNNKKSHSDTGKTDWAGYVGNEYQGLNSSTSQGQSFKQSICSSERKEHLPSPRAKMLRGTSWAQQENSHNVRRLVQVKKLDSQEVTQKQHNLWSQETSQTSPACSVNLSSLLWHNYSNSQVPTFCSYKEKRFLWEMWPGEAKVGREGRVGSGKQDSGWSDLPREAALQETQIWPACMALDRCQPKGGKGKNKTSGKKFCPCKKSHLTQWFQSGSICLHSRDNPTWHKCKQCHLAEHPTLALSVKLN